MALIGSTIKQQLLMDGAKVKGTHTDGVSLNADGLHAATVFLRDGFETIGSVRLSNATLHSLVLGGGKGAKLGESPRGHSLSAGGMHVSGEVAFDDGFEATGDVWLAGTTIDGALMFRGAGRIGDLNLTAARCEYLVDKKDSWPGPGRLALRGFRFGTLITEVGVKERLDWIRRQGPHNWSTDPYEHLANYYSSTGDEGAARRIRIAKYQDELNHVKRTKGVNSLWYRVWRRPLGWLVGYGYRRWPAGLMLVALLIAAGGIFHIADRDGAMVPNAPTIDDAGNPVSCGAAYPCFNSWLYGADVVLPIIDFDQDDAWRPVATSSGDPWWIWARWAFIAIGWALASIFVAAFTALVQRS